VRETRLRPTAYVGQVPSYRTVTPEKVEGIVRARAAGAPAREVARAFDVGLRTVYRWARARIVTVTVDGWHARFAIRPDRDGVRPGPVQLEGWKQVRGVVE